MSIWRYANPAEFMRVSGAVLPWCAGLGAVSLAVGVLWGLFLTPTNPEQGESARILYIHVPASMLAINIYFMMAIASVIGLVRRHHVSFLAAKAAAPMGAAMTALALITGALWGAPTWGTWWVWDPKLTSVLIMFFFYIGYIALWNAIDDPEKAADLTAVLCLVGVVFAVMSRYAVEIFDGRTLHQPASLTLAEGENVANVYYLPLVVSITGFYLTFITLLLARTRTEIRLRRARSLAMQAARG
ncbi:heme ABC transporter permease CcmC [Pikeienuella sp. HZG-20]|uniref:heme ABC transporter permease CcmC n=1 Tax=Paludibacillus litoralis TaxID=3133267 RepID=UPI0030ECD5BC